MKKITNTNLIEGSLYLNKKKQELIYIGKFPYFTENKEYQKERFVFYNKNLKLYKYYTTINNKNFMIINYEKQNIEDYKQYIHNDCKHFFDCKKYKYKTYSKDDFINMIQENQYKKYIIKINFFIEKKYNYYTLEFFEITKDDFILSPLFFKYKDEPYTYEELEYFYKKYKPCYLEENT